jgi:uncharacterized RDD family membrane protein YckC
MWYYADNGRQMGPVDEAALDDLVRQGLVKDNTLVWREGMAAWQPHSTARPRPVPTPVASAPAAAAPAPAPIPTPIAASTETRYCAECGRGYPANELGMVGNVAVCGACRPAVMQRMAAAPPPAAQGYGAQPYGAQPYAQPYGAVPGAAQQMMMGGTRYAGFWIRFVARLIDGIIVGIVGFIITLPLTMLLGVGSVGLSGAFGRGDPAAAMAAIPALLGFIGISTLLRIVISGAYEVYFLTTKGATPGKMALGLKVIKPDGTPISIGLATGRYFGLMLSAIILWIGYIMAGFDPEKRALHDRLCETRVVYAK